MTHVVVSDADRVRYARAVETVLSWCNHGWGECSDQKRIEGEDIGWLSDVLEAAIGEKE